MTSSNVLFCPQPKDFHIAVIEEEGHLNLKLKKKILKPLNGLL